MRQASPSRLDVAQGSLVAMRKKVSCVTQARRHRKKGILVAATSTGSAPSRSCAPATGALPVNGNTCVISGSAKTQPARTQFAAVQQDGSQAGVRAGWLCRFLAGLSPASSTGASELWLHAACFEAVFSASDLFLVLLLLFQLLSAFPAASLRQPQPVRLEDHCHDHSPLGSSLPCTSASHCGPDVHKVASLPSEKSEPRHTGSSPPEKGDFGSGDADRARSIGGLSQHNQQMRNRHTTVARAAVALPISGRSFSGQLDRCVRRHWPPVEKGAGNLTVCDAGPARAPNVRLIKPISPWYNFSHFRICTIPLLATQPAGVHSGDEPCL